MANPSDGEPAGGWPNPESAQIRGRQAATREHLRETLPVRAVQRSAGKQTGFPDEAELEYERSVIRIPFYLKGKARTDSRHDVDIMAFDAYMRLLREKPIRNGLGLRQFQFFIDSWELNNTYSKGLNADVTFTLSDCEQPKSLCISLQRESDYPAMIVYNAIYDVYVGKERIITHQAGTAVAMPVREIPPRNTTVAFEKPFDSDLFSFSAGSCEGMRSINKEEFERGVMAARSIRGG